MSGLAGMLDRGSVFVLALAAGGLLSLVGCGSLWFAVVRYGQ